MIEILLPILAAAAGACIVVQQALNANLRVALGSAARVPWWGWTGGLFGATYIALAILLVPRLGSAAFIGLLVAGQMVTSVLFDHFGWLGLAQRPLDVARAAGIVLLVAGVALIRR